MGWNSTGYSADVAIWLVCGNRRIKLSHASDTFIVTAEVVNLPAGDARIELTVDGDRFERQVSLPGRLSPDKRREIPVTYRELLPF